MLHTVEAANVLLMDKMVFLNRDVLSTFVALGPAQIARILNFFNPDEYVVHSFPNVCPSLYRNILHTQMLEDQLSFFLIIFFSVSQESLPAKVAHQVAQWTQQYPKYHLHVAQNLP